MVKKNVSMTREYWIKKKEYKGNFVILNWKTATIVTINPFQWAYQPLYNEILDWCKVNIKGAWGVNKKGGNFGFADKADAALFRLQWS